MATENPALPISEEHVGPAAENAPETPAACGEKVFSAENTASATSGAEAVSAAQPVSESGAEAESSEGSACTRRPRIGTESAAVDETDEESAGTHSEVDFSEEDAALAARNAGLEIEGETPEEMQAGERSAGGDTFDGRNKEELLGYFARLIEERPVQTIRHEIETLKIAFYRLRRAEVDAARRAFLETGEPEEAFMPPLDDAETRFKELFKEYRRRRDEFIAGLEAQQQNNLRIKSGIIDELRELISSDETLNHTFARFRELQSRWKETGPVPQAQVKDLWETYNLHVENFYNFIKINKELRDLDLRKNYERKTALCEQAEALAQEPSVVEAFRKLQKLHDEWRETGPVANEFKEPLWERFREASTRINKLHQEHFDALKSEQLENLRLKTELCVACEELLAEPALFHKEWMRASERLLELQKNWKAVGFAPKKDNARIYERFRTACDKFFESKRRFYAEQKIEMDRNRQLKTELCEAAEALAESEDWKKATDEMIALQARWKQIGVVPRRYSDIIWKRFRTACDRFFERKSAHFATVDGEYGENLQKKLALLDRMQAADVREGGFETIREFQRQWSEIGFVPIKQKNAVQKRYKEVMDALFAALRGSERDRSMNRFREKVSSLKAAGDRRLTSEREKLCIRVRQLEQEAAQLENNVGFFARSKGAEALIAEVRSKIDRLRDEIAATVEKVKLLDRQAREEQNDNEQ